MVLAGHLAGERQVVERLGAVIEPVLGHPAQVEVANAVRLVEGRGVVLEILQPLEGRFVPGILVVVLGTPEVGEGCAAAGENEEEESTAHDRRIIRGPGAGKEAGNGAWRVAVPDATERAPTRKPRTRAPGADHAASRGPVGPHDMRRERRRSKIGSEEQKTSRMLEWRP